MSLQAGAQRSGFIFGGPISFYFKRDEKIKRRGNSPAVFVRERPQVFRKPELGYSGFLA